MLRQLLDANLDVHFIIQLWPSEIAALAASAKMFRRTPAVAKHILRAPAIRAAMLAMVSKNVGDSTAPAVLACAGQGPWPSWRDGLTVLRLCGQPVHSDPRALARALHSGLTGAVAWLLCMRANAEVAIEGDLTPLRLVARQGNKQMVRILLDCRAEPNTRSRYGYTALMMAAMHGHQAIVEMLLAGGGQVNTNGDGETAIDLAHRHPSVVATLQEHVAAYGWTGSVAASSE